ncbi:TetR/AcrR family transcriptional regulator [Streptomyces sp. NPDC096311]|uniref:TetR/AcrR family transcriptional regulator n=1 Tax=Streptomyces sp. NPDC096311 TaxID=3366083 RepID=UPI003817057D
MMSEERNLRRDGYGPTSPHVGARGAQTRRRIVAEALALFGEFGYHGTSVENIASASGVSRAALYQYFESKEQIFVELLDECGSALMRVVRRLGPLGPTEEGFDNLRWWLGEWAWVYDKYATMFVEWEHVDQSGDTVRPTVLGFIRSYNGRIAGRLVSSGVAGMEAGEAALALTAIVSHFNYLRHRGTLALPGPEEAVDGLSVPMQLMLFPDTPTHVLGILDDGSRLAHDLATPGMVPPRARTSVWPGGELGARAAETARRILDHGAVLLARRGYHEASIDELIIAAGFARATFYKYFEDKLDLLRRLSAECQAALDDLLPGLADIRPGTDGGAALRRWLGEFVTFHRRYRGVLRTWTQGSVTDPEIARMAEQSNAALRAAVVQVLARIERSYPLDPDVAAGVFIAVLDRLPGEAADVAPNLSESDIVELLAVVLERGLLNSHQADEIAR